MHRVDLPRIEVLLKDFCSSLLKLNRKQNGYVGCFSRAFLLRSGSKTQLNLYIYIFYSKLSPYFNGIAQGCWFVSCLKFFFLTSKHWFLPGIRDILPFHAFPAQNHKFSHISQLCRPGNDLKMSKLGQKMQNMDLPL